MGRGEPGDAVGLNDIEIPWDDFSPEMQEQLLKLNRALFQDPDWLPPEGMTVGQTVIPAETWDELFDDVDE